MRGESRGVLVAGGGVLGALALLVLAGVAAAETLVVTSTADSGPGTLRAAVERANSNG